MIEMAKKTVKEGLSVRELETSVSKGKKTNGKKKKKTDKKDPFMEDVIRSLEKKYATKVEIRNKMISIKYTDTEDLNRILEIMGVIED